MDRLLLISHLDPEWHLAIETFLDQNPEFWPYAYLVPMQRPRFNASLKPKYFIEHLLRYICEAGVNSNYAQKQYNLILSYLQKNNYDIGLMLDQIGDQLQPKKRAIYSDIWKAVKEIGPLNYRLEHLLATKIKGVGVGCVAQLKQFWSSEPDAVEISDRGFIAGFTKVYNLDKKPTPSQIKKKVETWKSNKIVGGLLCTQIFHYLIR
jgi:3-methyladenine DNA glycosylase/8-oxoguanine DNA glycosylase